MSKMGQWNLELQEQANELGFETTQEALDNDYSIVDGQLTYDAEKGLKSAHEAWLKEKEKVLTEAKEIQKFFHEYDNRAPEFKGITVYADNIVKFIKEAHD